MLSGLNQFSRLDLYRKINSNITEFVGYATYLAITKHVDLILNDFNEDSLLNERPIIMSLQSLGFTQVVSEPTHIRGACLDYIYIRNNQNSFPNFDALLNSAYFSDHDLIVLYYQNWMVIILFKTTSFTSKTDKLTSYFFCFFIESTIKLKTNYIIFFIEIMDSFSPK